MNIKYMRRIFIITIIAVAFGSAPFISFAQEGGGCGWLACDEGFTCINNFADGGTCTSNENISPKKKRDLPVWYQWQGTEDAVETTSAKPEEGFLSWFARAFSRPTTNNTATQRAGAAQDVAAGTAAHENCKALRGQPFGTTGLCYLGEDCDIGACNTKNNIPAGAIKDQCANPNKQLDCTLPDGKKGYCGGVIGENKKCMPWIYEKAIQPTNTIQPLTPTTYALIPKTGPATPYIQTKPYNQPILPCRISGSNPTTGGNICLYPEECKIGSSAQQKKCLDDFLATHNC